VVIRSSSARDVRQLVEDLRQGTPLAREAAIARLRVLGGRAFASLSALVQKDGNAAARVAGLKVLDGLDDPRVVDVAARALGDADDEVRLAAVLALRSWLAQEDGTRILDALAGLALDKTQSAVVRGAARDALSEELPPTIVQPILARAGLNVSAPPTEDPRAVRDWMTEHADAPLTTLHDLVTRLREREQAEPRKRWKLEWLEARGAVHAALARRGSRVALYDLREAFESAASPLPPEFLTSMAALGDTTCLEPLARAASSTAGDEGWRNRLARTAAAIVSRLGLTGRNPAVKRVRQRWPGFL
jgi:hypothetical protein